MGEMLSEISHKVYLASMDGDLEIQVTELGRKKLVSEIIHGGYVDYDVLALRGPGPLEPVTDYVGTITGVDVRVVPEWETGAMFRVVVKGEA